MNLSEFNDGNTKCLFWTCPDHGWDDVNRRVEEFLVRVIETISGIEDTRATTWLELNHWPDSGRLIAWNSADGPFGNREGEEYCLTLSSSFLENRCNEIASLSNEEQADSEWRELRNSLWSRVRECLQSGPAHDALQIARDRHQLKVAAYDYNAGEGPFYFFANAESVRDELERLWMNNNREFGIET